MKANNYFKIIVLTAMIALGGCAGNAPQPMTLTSDRPILSAEQAQTMIQVTVTTRQAAEPRKTVVAANTAE